MSGQVEAGIRKSMEPWIKDEVQFYEHQITGIRDMMRMRHFLLADDMGLGKSLQSIVVGAGDIIRGWAEKILVVCPVTLKSNWSDEYDKFTGIPHMIFGQAIDPKNPERMKPLSAVKREYQLEEFGAMSGPRVLIANYEQIAKHLKAINEIKFDICILDEAHFIKNPRAQRTKAVHKIRANRFFLLTGTPMLNNVDELWSLLHRIDPAAYPNYFAFRNRYCVFGGWQDKQIIGTKNEKELQERLKSVMIRRLKEDVLDLPDIQYIVKKVDLSEGQRKLYDKAEKELEVEMVGQDDPSEIENALTKLLRLKQICGTTVTFTGVDDSAKLDTAIDDAFGLLANGHKIVVFTQFRDVLEAFCTRLDKAMSETPIWELHGGIPQHDRQPYVRAWSEDKRPGALVCMLQVAGVGLNMTAARHAMFLDKLWTPGMNQQAVDRLHRIGQDVTQPVQVYEYHMKGTVETRVEYILRTKSKLFGTIVNDADFKKKLLDAIRNRNAA